MIKNKKVNILTVDDKESNLFVLEQILSNSERNIIKATTGKEALTIILNGDIDLIILDVQMPEMDGFEIAQILKSNKRTKEIPIIFASAERKERKFMMKGFEEGGVDYLHKPLDKEITEAKVSVLLKLQLQKKELSEKNLALEKYALLINNSADLICIINPANFKLEEINNAVTPMLGYLPDEIRNNSLLLYITEEYGFVLKKLSSDSRENFSFEAQIYCKNRVVKWLNWNIVSKDGLWFANARDITEIKEVEEIKNYLAAVVKQSTDAIYLHDAEGKIISWNQGCEKIYGFSEEEGLNMNIWNIVPEFLMKETQDMVNNILNGQQIQFVETKRITKYGKIIDVIFSASVIKDFNGTLKSVAITERDITQQKKSELEIKQLNFELKKNVAELEITNKELESFSYSVSHDLRAPLRAVNGYAKMLEEDYNSILDKEGNHLIDVIKESAKTMGILIDDLLAFSKLGRKELHKSLINMAELTQISLKEINNSVNHEAKIKINELHPVMADPLLIKQVILNLLSNAIKYSSKKEKPYIEINSELEDQMITYSVKDNGAGFEMKYIDKLFGVFQRLHSANEFEGTGVGLALVQRIIIKHGGKVWGEGKVNEGAVFYFTLPL